MNECGQYRNPERGRQLILFDGLQYGDMSPTDIDGILDGKNRIWLVFEAKLADAPMRRGQRLTLERLVQDAGKAGKHGMKRQPSEWEKIIANEAIDKELIS